MSSVVNDLRYGLRQLWKAPGLTLVIVVVLSLGMSVSVTIFGIADWRLHPPSPFSDPRRIVHLSASSETVRQEPLSYLDFLALREQLPSLAGLATVSVGDALLKQGGWSWKHDLAEVSGNFFSVAGVRAYLGKVFSEQDPPDPSSPPAVVLSYRVWRSQFGSDPTIVGRSILLNETSRIILGVAPPSFHSVSSSSFEGGPVVDFWIPVSLRDEPEGCTVESLVGRLKSGASPQTLLRETEAAFQRLKLRNPNTLEPLKPTVLSDDEYRNPGGYPAPALFLIGLGCTILLIACLNVSGSLLAKSDTRRTEMAVRQALGGSRLRLIRQLFAEGALLALLALGLSLLVSYWLMSLLRSLLASGAAQACPVDYLNPRTVVFSFSLALVGTLLFELLPVWRTCQTNLISALKADRRDHSGWGRGPRGLAVLVVFQLAIALILTVGAGVLTRSYFRASFTNLRFPRKNVLLARLEPGQGPEQNRAFFTDLVAQVQTLPGVEKVGLGLLAPTDRNRGGKRYHVSLPGDSVSGPGPSQTIAANIVNPGYFAVAGLAILKGRNFAERTNPLDSRQVIINEACAARFWPDTDPVGRLVRLADSPRGHVTTEVAQVVGVVRDVRDGGPRETSDPYLYVPWGQVPSDRMTLLVETRGDPRFLADPIRSIVQRLDGSIPVYPMTTLSEEAQRLVKGRAVDAGLIGSLSLIGMALASIGVYGIVAFAVTRRTHELGVRMALGARSGDVMRMVMGQGLKLSLIGLLLGLVGSVILNRILRASFVGMGPLDLVVFAGSSLALIGAALLACYLPARRAAKIDPMAALRYE
jgi:predicted permease